VRAECAARGVRYTHYKTLAGNLAGFTACMRELGTAPDEPAPVQMARMVTRSASKGKLAGKAA
jgi:hypothetical protein